MERLTIEERKEIPTDCPNCGKTFKNVYSKSAHKGYCLGLNDYESRSQEAKDKMAWSRGKILKSDEEIFCEYSMCDTGYVKNVLLVKGIKEYKCEGCGITEWNGKEITMELDHINGNNRDNRLKNLRFLCPNCHSQTDTWRGRNKVSQGKTKVSDEILLAALNETSSIREALIKVGLAAKGGNYSRCKRLLARV